MAGSSFDLTQQEQELSSKIVVGLERISEAFRSLLWAHAKVIGISPIQIQILIFVGHHKQELCTVSYLAKEFNVTKPTISDAVRVLLKKGLIVKGSSASDNRSYSILLSAKGQKILAETQQFASPIKQQLDQVPLPQLEALSTTLNDLIFGLHRAGILSVQRTCFGCRFYEAKTTEDFCHYLGKELPSKDIRLDCAEYEPTQQD